MEKALEKNVSKQQEIPEHMKAIVAYSPKNYKLEEKVKSPKLENEKEIIIKVEACGICAGDIKAYEGAPSFWGDETQPAYIKAPMIPGHEFIGRIVQKGEAVTDFEVGDRVISEQIVPCWECRFCNRGQYWMCEKHDLYGFQNNVNGGMAEYMKFTKEAINYKVPEDLPIEDAILIEPYACSLHAVQRAQVQLGDIVVLSGAGTLGLGMVGAIKKAGPKKLVVLDMKEDRLKLAKQFGADIVLNPSKTDVVKEIKDMTDGYGCDIYIEATGHPKSVEQGLHAIRKLGRFVEFSVFGEPVSVDWSIISDRKELDLLGSHLGPYCYPLVIEGISNGDFPTAGVVTHQLPLEDFEKGFELMKKGDKSLKIILQP
ncbi:MAG: MDR/zinc-dependent alcohol dehydrogenase-like family protein [Bacillota bacterium]|uniref:Alcohol dehydrogenase catalytic domain-containing protein n=1 Tax=Virgibacillus salarius TaxID=447199 RepID=A0A941E317_9BACI|nr:MULTISPECIES: alcohol dehydrogenase catalytic domain-containing protein [Bacillaceae]NAZ10642.1 alcohol dehydrogenase catalytic domain-containing protein [Agaribacter marinus]MBR7797933.1 alcohol dehydrogenase catalytic domain-containing protein [Virgibacillus salarius]MCC2250006.1 alcohol dehydrogenase catalytic domain-containing protein [Virgibacillus sp. AGTR]MDY7044656.1 alcohol dehydrogenase catalytic domain-containing protein [Virgibacillus sp. M23]QRZ18140.1 alcohol dehydrogenase cat